METVERSIASIADNSSFVSANKGIVDAMLLLLETHFPEGGKESGGLSLAIACGRGRYSFSRSKITHSHQQQWHFVHQSLSLWKAVLEDFFRLWFLAEADMLSERSRYRLRNTGQGLNRVQACPLVGAAMGSILRQVQSSARRRWEGISVIHLGDRDVPNALVFIDKYVNVEPSSHTHETCNLHSFTPRSAATSTILIYVYILVYILPQTSSPTCLSFSRYTQVSRILHPICRAINGIDDLMADPGLSDFVMSTFGSADACKKVHRKQKTERRGDVE